MARFTYKGPFQARTIQPIVTDKKVDDEKKLQPVFDGNLARGKTYDLPADHPEIVALIAGGLLVPEQEAASDAAALEEKSGEAVEKPKTKKEAK